MMKKTLTLIVTILTLGAIVAHAKINYVPLYIIDTHTDVKVVKKQPAAPLFITQDDHKLILPELDDSLMLVVLSGDEQVYSRERSPYETEPVNLPAKLVGDFEVRLYAVTSTYYYYGFITLEAKTGTDTSGYPGAVGNPDSIPQIGSNTPSQALLDNLMKLHTVTDSAQHIYLLHDEVYEYLPHLISDDGSGGYDILAFYPVLISCIQELKYQLDSRTEAMIDIMMSRSTDTSAVREIRAAIGSTLLSAASTPVGESALVRFVLADDVTDAYITVTDMGGRLVAKVAVSPSDTSATIVSGVLGEGVYLCTLFANGQKVGTTRLVKTK